MKLLLISTAVIVILCMGLFHLSITETFYAWLAIGIITFVIRAALGLLSSIGNALAGRRGDTYNFNANVTEEHKHGDPTRPGEEIYPAVVEVHRQIGKGK